MNSDLIIRVLGNYSHPIFFLDQTIRNLADKGILRCIRLRPPDQGGYSFRPEDIEAFIENYGPPSVTTGVVEKEPCGVRQTQQEALTGPEKVFGKVLGIDLLTEEEAAGVFGCSVDTIRYLAETEVLVPVRLTGRVRL